MNLSPRRIVPNGDRCMKDQLLLPFIGSEIDNLSIRALKSLQKADHVYLSKENHLTLKDHIRRDSDVTIMNDNELSTSFIESFLVRSGLMICQD